MKRKYWIFLVLIGLVIAGGGVFLLSKNVLVLQLQNMDRSRTLSVRIKPMERFSVYYIQSNFQGPVIEEFEAAPNTIILKGVRTLNPAIAEQYGFDDSRTFHPMDEKLGALFLRIAPGEGQGIIVRERKIYLGEIGERGDRIQLSVRSISRLSYLLTFLF